ncbi:unnamed protein product [Dovyalis caffra]|uniref:Uncharacterized protein n=1 Tax=Dovyalis caffra TaxID=77055 RepID=A0AAV1RYZ0_9ROSI|nr:unnamed protein product [Dovyalis caffra]
MSFLLRKTIKSNSTLQSFRPNNTLPLFLHQDTKHFSTETQPPPQENNDTSSIDPFLQSSNTSLAYARFYGVRKHTMKTDIINLFEGSNLTHDNIRFIHNRSYIPFAAGAYDNAQKALTRAGRLYRMEKTEPHVWDAALRNCYDGKTVLLEGLPPNALTDDIERFLSGLEFLPSSIKTFARRQDPINSQGRKDLTTSEGKRDATTSEEKENLNASEEKKISLEWLLYAFPHVLRR